MFSNQPLICDVNLPPEKRSLYYQILAHEYKALKQACILYSHSRGVHTFNEDVFQDTTINCVNKCCLMTSHDDIYRYFCSAYMTNLLREEQYANNKHLKNAHKLEYNESSRKDGTTTKGDSIEAHIAQECNNETFDTFRREVYEYVKKDKGERIANIIHDYVDGYSYDELTKKYDIKNIHKKAGALKTYMKNLIENWGTI